MATYVQSVAVTDEGVAIDVAGPVNRSTYSLTLRNEGPDEVTVYFNGSGAGAGIELGVDAPDNYYEGPDEITELFAETTAAATATLTVVSRVRI